MQILNCTIPKPPSDPSALIASAYDEYSDAIFRHCYYRLYSRDLGKDLMQETFMKAWDYLQKGKTIDNVRAFLYRIANNLIIDHVRKKHEQSLEALQEAGFDPTGDSGREIIEKVDEKFILATLEKLETADRDLVVMRYIDEMKPQEIAEILKIEPNAASVRIHRAMQQLKTILKDNS